jgi:hypothetical protein
MKKIADRKLFEKSLAVEREMNLKTGVGDAELKCALRGTKEQKPQDLGEFLWEDWGRINKRVSSSAYLYCEAIRNRPACFTKKHNTISRLATIPSCINTS